MKLKEIYDFLNEKAPFELSESWDNCGILLGSEDTGVESVVLSLDLSMQVLDDAKENSLIITHHPFIFSSFKKIDYSTGVGAIIKKAIQKNISIIAMHTNYDKAVLNSYFTRTVLGFADFTSDGFVCKVDVDMSFDELLKRVKHRIALPIANCVIPRNNMVKKIGITTGSGSEFIFSSDVDVYLTGDVKYHTAFEAKERGIGIVDISHYASELCFGVSLAEILNILPIEVIIANSKNPFEQC